MSDVIDGLSGEDKAGGFELERQETDHERQSAILANMLKNGMPPEQIAKNAGVSLDEMASLASTQGSLMEQGKDHAPDIRKNLEESMRAHDDLYRELAGEGLPDGERRPVHP